MGRGAAERPSPPRTGDIQDYRTDFASTFTVSQQDTGLPSTLLLKQTGIDPLLRPATARMS